MAIPRSRGGRARSRRPAAERRTAEPKFLVSRGRRAAPGKKRRRRRCGDRSGSFQTRTLRPDQAREAAWAGAEMTAHPPTPSGFLTAGRAPWQASARRPPRSRAAEPTQIDKAPSRSQTARRRPPPGRPKADRRPLVGRGAAPTLVPAIGRCADAAGPPSRPPPSPMPRPAPRRSPAQPREPGPAAVAARACRCGSCARR